MLMIFGHCGENFMFNWSSSAEGSDEGRGCVCFGGGGEIRLIVGFQPLMDTISPTAS